MGGGLAKVRKGDRQVIPAETFNTFIDAARDWKERTQTLGLSPPRERRDAGNILVENTSGAARPRGAVLGITGARIKPVDNEDGFNERVLVYGGVPAEPTLQRFVVLLEPAPLGAIVTACASGCCAVKVEMTTEDDLYADAITADTSKLKSAASGIASILWAEPPPDRETPGIARSIVRLGGGAGEGGIYLAKITALNDLPMRITVRHLDSGGSPTGDPFTVKVRTWWANSWEPPPHIPLAVDHTVLIARVQPSGDWYCIWAFVGTCGLV